VDAGYTLTTAEKRG